MRFRLTLSRAGSIMTALAVGLLIPGLGVADTAGVIHQPTGHLYVVSGTGSMHELQQQAQTACEQQEGIAGTPRAAHQCTIMKNLPSGPCVAAYGKGNQNVTVGGYKWEKISGYTGFIHCGKTEAESDQLFKQHCASHGCAIWQHYTDQYNH